MHKTKFKCNLCDAKFETRQLVNDHVKNVHNPTVELKGEGYTYVCDEDGCGKTFRSKRGKIGHMEKSHVSNGKYTCPTCQRNFGTKQTLNNHLSTHSDEKRFKCEHCGKKYKRKNEVTRHINQDSCPALKKVALHGEGSENSGAIKCDLCCIKCENKEALVTHLALNHQDNGNSFECETCSKTFPRKAQLTAHKLVHLRKGNTASKKT